MRITTQMLHNSSIKSGITFNRTSLLDYVNNPSKADSFLNALATGSYASEKSSSILSSKNYKELLEKAESLEKNADNLCKTDEKSVYATAKEKDDKKLFDGLFEDFIKDCNETLEALNTTGSAVDSYYAKTLKELNAENKEILATMGINIDSKTSKLSYENKKINEMDFDTISANLEKLSDYASKVKFIASRAVDNANTSLKSTSNIYNANGKNAATTADYKQYSRHSYKS